MEEEHGVRGGQGTDAHNVSCSAKWVGLMILFAIAIVVASLLVGCVSTHHSHEDNEELHPNMPSTNELRNLNTF